MATTQNWYDSATNLSKFLSALIDAGVVEDTDDVQQFLDKPQRYDDIYEAWDEAGFPSDGEDNWDEFVSAVSDEDTEETEDES